ncbi:MAG: hypothetical protein AB8F94_17190 [Saprospiraceae bacterium]
MKNWLKIIVSVISLITLFLIIYFLINYFDIKLLPKEVKDLIGLGDNLAGFLSGLISLIVFLFGLIANAIKERQNQKKYENRIVELST